MNENQKFYFKIGIALLFIAYLLYRSPKSTGSAYMPDMAYSTAYETYDARNPLASAISKMSSLLPVENTISRNSLPSQVLYSKEPSVVYSYNYTRFFQNNDAEKMRAGIEINNPYTATPEVLKRGEAIYKNQCAICHGEKGMGDGPLIVRADGSEGAYKAVPPTYADRLKGMKDGEIFHSITYGKNLMGGYAAHVKADDRWKLVCYIKQLGGMNGGGSSTTDSTKTLAVVSPEIKVEKK